MADGANGIPPPHDLETGGGGGGAGATRAVVSSAAAAATAAAVLASIKEADTREPGVGSNLSYEETKNLLWIEKDPLCYAALREWDRKELYLGSRVDRREKASADVVNQIFNIVGFFSVFQGVVLTAVTQLQSDDFATCSLIWSPCVLSVVAAAVSIVGLSLKFRTLGELELSIDNEKALHKEVAKRATQLRSQGKEKFRFVKSAPDTHPSGPKIKSFHITRILVVLSLCVFTVLFVLSYFAILCDSFAIRAWKGGLHRP